MIRSFNCNGKAREELKGVHAQGEEEERVEVVTRRNDAVAEQGTRETDNAEKNTRAGGAGEHRRGYGEGGERWRLGARRARFAGE